MAEAIRRRRADPAVRAAEAQAKREARRAKCEGSAQVFEQQFRDNPFGYTCSVCHLLWFKNDLTVLPEACHSILRPVFPEADLTSFHLCASCKQSVLQGQVPRLATTNGYGYPARQESNVPSTRPEAASALNSISTQRRRPYLCKKHTTKSKGTSTSSLTRIRSSPSMRSRNTQTEVCAQADRVTQTARIVIGTATQT
ncbi:hypothetical protein V5799_015176 [Amblyomma americanum]|uniref:Uncharacterized protein n=1 Tax=Amblyomma americanum TaxID=6943 RepID=A0AAQ4E0X0_AMBAM